MPNVLPAAAIVLKGIMRFFSDLFKRGAVTEEDELKGLSTKDRRIDEDWKWRRGQAPVRGTEAFRASNHIERAGLAVTASQCKYNLGFHPR